MDDQVALPQCHKGRMPSQELIYVFRVVGRKRGVILSSLTIGSSRVFARKIAKASTSVPAVFGRTTSMICALCPWNSDCHRFACTPIDQCIGAEMLRSG